MKDKCKCHGVSGSCSMKTCWKKLSDFNATATLLRQKYNQAIRKAPNARTMRREAPSSRVKKPKQRRKKVCKKKLKSLLKRTLTLYSLIAAATISVYNAILFGNFAHLLFRYQGSSMPESRQLCESLLWAWLHDTRFQTSWKMSLPLQ